MCVCVCVQKKYTLLLHVIRKPIQCITASKEPPPQTLTTRYPSHTQDGPQLTWGQLVSFVHCREGEQPYSCTIFSDRHPSTISMSVLVVVEMFNALNALSENESLLRVCILVVGVCAFVVDCV